MFLPSNAFRIFLGDSSLIFLKNRNFCTHENNSHIYPKSFCPDSFCRRLIYKLLRSSYFFRIFGVPEVFDKVRLLQTVLFWQILFSLCCVLILMALWFIWWVFAIENLEYSIYNTKTKFMSFSARSNNYHPGRS